MRSLLQLLVLVTSTVLVIGVDMDTIYQWKYVDYIWESEAAKQQAINSGQYNYTQIAIMDVDRAPDGRVFVTMVGKSNAPAALATVTDQMGHSGPLLKPYPDWSYFKKDDCNSIANVFRVAIDRCERLWVLDAGRMDDEGSKNCNPQLLAFDLKTDRLIKRIQIPKNIAGGKNEDTILTNPIVETNGEQCEDTTVYMSHTLGYGMIIWNNGKLSRLENPLFRPSEAATKFTSGKYTVEWQAGLLGMDISPKIFPGEESYLYFRALSSFDLYAVKTSELKKSVDGNEIDISGAENVMKRQAEGIAFSAEGTLFMGQTGNSAIACWNRYQALKPSNFEIVTRDEERLQYVNGVKVKHMPNTKDEELLVLSNRLVAFDLDKLDFNEYNFHILSSPVKKLIANTLCEMPKKEN